MFYYMDLIRLDFVFFTNLTDIYTMSTKKTITLDNVR